MPFLNNQMVLSPAFTIELCWRDAVAFIREVEAEAVKTTLTEMTRSWDIRGSYVRLNRVFKLNNLRYGPYPEQGSADVGMLRSVKRVG